VLFILFSIKLVFNRTLMTLIMLICADQICVDLLNLCHLCAIILFLTSNQQLGLGNKIYFQEQFLHLFNVKYPGVM
jgi:hypothetical protein